SIAFRNSLAVPTSTLAAWSPKNPSSTIPTATTAEIQLDVRVSRLPRSRAIADPIPIPTAATSAPLSVNVAANSSAAAPALPATRRFASTRRVLGVTGGAADESLSRSIEVRRSSRRQPLPPHPQKDDALIPNVE